MSNTKNIYKSVLKDLGPIVLRNLFSLVVIIIGGLSIVLVALGDVRDGIFLASVIVINIIVGIIQELRAKVSLEKLQAINQATYKRVNGDNVETVYPEQIMVGDQIELSLGDQVPADGKIAKTTGVEFNEALLTGESANIAKRIDQEVYAGSIVVAGTATLKVTKLLANSFVGQMTSDIKHYKRNLSPIQSSLLRFIQIMAVVLVGMAAIVLVRNSIAHIALVDSVRQIAALAATVIAEGLILTSTLLFSYGAIRMGRKKVLLQQISATEGLGRIEYLCVDKTGTLTENLPRFDKLVSYDKPKFPIKKVVEHYLGSTGQTSATAQALAEHFHPGQHFETTGLEPFSSARKYGSVTIKTGSNEMMIFVGAPEKFYERLDKKELNWVQDRLKSFGLEAKRSILVGTEVKDKFSLHCLLVLSNPLKKGTVETVELLQKRGIHIKVISGDNSTTVRAVANAAGIAGDSAIDGEELARLNGEAFAGAVAGHNLFARIAPEQKQQIIQACQAQGFSAMVGDGANDALAIKQSNLGIAMYEGAPATRQIADVVLLDNNFAAIPRGIQISDTTITTLEMIAMIFFTRIWLGLFLFAGSVIGNFAYPISPRNITIMNIFIVGFPVVLWSFWPRVRKRHLHEKFLGRTLPFSVINGLVLSLAVLVIYQAAMRFGLGVAQAQMAGLWVFLLGCAFTLLLIPKVAQTDPDKKQDHLLKWVIAGTAAALLLLSNIRPVAHFFDLVSLNPVAYAGVVAVIIVAGLIQYSLARVFQKNISK